MGKIGKQYKLEFNDKTIGYYNSDKTLSCAMGKLSRKATKNNLATNEIKIENLSGVNIGNKKFNKC